MSAFAVATGVLFTAMVHEYLTMLARPAVLNGQNRVEWRHLSLSLHRRLVCRRRAPRHARPASRVEDWPDCWPSSLSVEPVPTRVAARRPDGGRDGRRGSCSRLRALGVVPTAGGTRVHFDWSVDPQVVWMRALSPLARPGFIWNHQALMAEGARRPRGPPRGRNASTPRLHAILGSCRVPTRGRNGAVSLNTVKLRLHQCSLGACRVRGG